MRARYTVILDREADGRITASVPGIPGCVVYGRTRKAAVQKAKSALEFYLQQMILEGKKPPRQTRPVAVEIQIAV